MYDIWKTGNAAGFGSGFSSRCLLLLLSILIPGTCFAASVFLEWDPSPDADLAGYRVYYQPDSDVLPFQGAGALEGAAPIDGGMATTATINGLDPGRSYYFAVTAYNSTGQESVYSNIISIAESLPPSVSIAASGATLPVQGVVSVAATASDNVGVARLQFFVNGALYAERSSEPFLFSWDTSALAAGSYDISAKAFDAAGNEATSNTLSIPVSGDGEAPSVSLSIPETATAVKGIVSIAASASDNVGVTGLELYLDGSLMSAGNANPFAYGWDSTLFADGSHTITAKAYDAAGNAGTASATVLVANLVSGNDAAVEVPVNLSDAREALEIASGRQAPTVEQLQRLDVAPYIAGQPRPNGRIDTGDVVVILSKLVGKL